MKDDPLLPDDVVWSCDIEHGKWRVEVDAIDGYAGTLYVYDGNTEEVVYEEEVSLTFDGEHGPNEDDVAEWKQITLEWIDLQYEE